jgi:hypothetical protein
VSTSHTYNHMMRELSLAYTFLEPASLVVVDNIELNGAFHIFVSATR